jgi:hypothetical protein
MEKYKKNIYLNGRMIMEVSYTKEPHNRWIFRIDWVINSALSKEDRHLIKEYEEIDKTSNIGISDSLLYDLEKYNRKIYTNKYIKRKIFFAEDVLSRDFSFILQRYIQTLLRMNRDRDTSGLTVEDGDIYYNNTLITSYKDKYAKGFVRALTRWKLIYRPRKMISKRRDNPIFNLDMQRQILRIEEATEKQLSSASFIMNRNKEVREKLRRVVFNLWGITLKGDVV